MTKRVSDEVVLAAIDVGTNAIRLELARVLPDRTIDPIHQERDPVRPGEGVFRKGTISKEVAARVVATLRRYGALCRRHRARIRAVATSAVREARNRQDLVRRVRAEARINLEIISGREEARLISLGVLQGAPPLRRSLCIDIGGGSTEIAFAIGSRPQGLWSVELGAVRLTELFDADGRVSEKQLKLMRRYARDALREALPERIKAAPRMALGSSGTIGAVVGFAHDEASGRVTRKKIARAVEALASMQPWQRRQQFEPRRADIIVAGAVVLEAVLDHFGLDEVMAVDRGLREGLLVDLADRLHHRQADPTLADTACGFGRRFDFDEAHGRKVSSLALALYDDLADVHALGASARTCLEVAGLLHDVGHAVSYPRHHKHSQYLIQNADLPGLSERERDLVGRIARFHRRSEPSRGHVGLADLQRRDRRVVQVCATLLRLADSLDRSHDQPVRAVRARPHRGKVILEVKARGAVDLELWDVEREAELFRRMFGMPFAVVVQRS